MKNEERKSKSRFDQKFWKAQTLSDSDTHYVILIQLLGRNNKMQEDYVIQETLNINSFSKNSICLSKFNIEKIQKIWELDKFVLKKQYQKLHTLVGIWIQAPVHRCIILVW